ncbi:TPA: DNA-binding protein [Pseudomonas aeruginosa]|nr:DNA-binding protein [Pseudomonas aeruginosa]
MTAETLSFEQLCELFNYTPKNRPLSTEEVSEFTGLAPNTLEQHRFKGTGPRFFNPAGTRRVWYSERDMLAWLASGARNSTSQQPGEALCI